MERKKTKGTNIRVELEGGLLRMFELIKSRRGVKNNTELIRLLIAEEFARSIK